jgi:pimeloyl-ACP methyl ester carboxylesterase
MKRFRGWMIAAGILLFVLVVLPFLIPLNQDGTPPEILAAGEGEFAEIDGVSLYIRQTGPIDGPPLLMLHGLLGTTEVWRMNRDALAAAGYRVIAFDRPGGGLSDKRWDLDYSSAHQAELTLHLLDHLGVEQAVFVGHSAGAKILGQIALKAPERARGFVYVAGALEQGGSPAFVGPLLNFPPFVRWMQIAVRILFSEERVIGLIDSFQGDPSFLTEADYAVYLRAFQTPHWDTGFLALSRDSGWGQVKAIELAEVAVPTLIIHGDIDSVVPLAASRELDAILPQSRLIEYANIGHQPMEEAADQFNQDLIAWLDALD